MTEEERQIGMFDLIKSSYNLGPQFTDVLCQTKDIEYDIGGTMTLYWISPDGVLWYPDYIGTNEYKVIEESDPDYNSKIPFLNFKWVPTGKHGRYRPYNLTKYIEIYPAEWKGDWRDWPRLRLHFKNGILQDFEEVTRTT